MKINVLGTAYTVLTKDEYTEPHLKTCDGFCDTTKKTCVTDACKNDSPAAKKDMAQYTKLITRHEIIHAFLFESGLDNNSWANNEETVDWIAIQFPKLYEAFRKIDAL